MKESAELPSLSRIASCGGGLMPRYFFDIKDGHRLTDRSGSDWKNDAAAIEKARVLAIGVSLDKPAVDPTRRISVLNADRVEISTVPIYSKPA
jgi:hypothetical protein